MPTEGVEKLERTKQLNTECLILKWSKANDYKGESLRISMIYLWLQVEEGCTINQIHPPIRFTSFFTNFSQFDSSLVFISSMLYDLYGLWCSWSQRSVLYLIQSHQIFAVKIWHFCWFGNPLIQDCNCNLLDT